jgi:hypothetical protein
MLRRLGQALAIVVLLAGSASAQSNLGIPIKPDKLPTQEESDKQKAADRAYNAALQKVPDKKSSVDPWGDVRPSSSTTVKNKQQ